MISLRYLLLRNGEAYWRGNLFGGIRTKNTFDKQDLWYNIFNPKDISKREVIYDTNINKK